MRAGQLTDELKAVARKLFVFGSPWPEWKTSGSFITELPSDANQDQPAPGDVAGNDAIGNRILLFVPNHLRESFLSPSGQRLVSHLLLCSPFNSCPETDGPRSVKRWVHHGHPISSACAVLRAKSLGLVLISSIQNTTVRRFRNSKSSLESRIRQRENGIHCSRQSFIQTGSIWTPGRYS